jgi:glycosyltransferase involved in cell wall biosynthesis
MEVEGTRSRAGALRLVAPRTRATPRVRVLVPAYNEAATIGGVIRELVAQGGRPFVVDDGSSDHTAELAAAAGAFVLHHRLNRGQGAALQTGLDFLLASGEAAPDDVIVTFDADGQHDAADLPALVAPILAGECDVVLGSRFLGSAEGMPWTRRLVLKLGIAFTRLVSRMRVTDTHNGLRAFSMRAAREIQLTSDGMAHASEIFDQIRESGLRWREAPVHVRYTAASLRKGQSNWNALRIAAHVLWRRVSS